MSYILEALKKAERERGIAQLPAMTSGRDVRGARWSRMAAVAAGLLVCVAVALLLFLPNRRALRPPEPAPAEAVRSRPANPPGGEPAGPPASAKTVPAPLESSSPAPYSGTMGSDRPQGRQRTAPVAASLQDDGNVPREVTAQRSSEKNSPATGQSAASDSSSQGKIPENLAPPLSEKAPPQPMPGTAGTEVKESTPASAVTQAKPLPLQEAIARMTLNILVYEDSEAARRVVINGRKYVKGDYVEGHYLVEDITLEGAVLSYDGQRALLRPR